MEEDEDEVSNEVGRAVELDIEPSKREIEISNQVSERFFASSPPLKHCKFDIDEKGNLVFDPKETLGHVFE